MTSVHLKLINKKEPMPNKHFLTNSGKVEQISSPQILRKRMELKLENAAVVLQ